ncbi:MAG: spore coat protein, partial [Clostridia bacterium]|nr:spore coat protein [Clostridia bacterium]
STPQVHSAFSKAFNDTLKMQNEVYAAMANKGWYPSTKAEQQQIDTLKQKYSSGC